MIFLDKKPQTHQQKPKKYKKEVKTLGKIVIAQFSDYVVHTKPSRPHFKRNGSNLTT